MKKVLLMASSLMILVGCQSSLTYNDTIVNELEEFSIFYEGYIDAEGEAMQPAIDAAVVSLTQTRTDLEALGAYDDKREFLDAALKVVSLYEEELTVIAPSFISETPVSDEVVDDYTASLEAALDDMTTKQAIFAAENGMQLE